MKTQNVQDIILNTARADKLFMTIFLTNGYQIKGKIAAFDNFVILVISEDKQHMIYKHAVSTIIPSKILEIRSNMEE